MRIRGISNIIYMEEWPSRRLVLNLLYNNIQGHVNGSQIFEYGLKR